MLRYRGYGDSAISYSDRGGIIGRLAGDAAAEPAPSAEPRFGLHHAFFKEIFTFHFGLTDRNKLEAIFSSFSLESGPGVGTHEQSCSPSNSAYMSHFKELLIDGHHRYF
jgi:hypothetical protein